MALANIIAYSISLFLVVGIFYAHGSSLNVYLYENGEESTKMFDITVRFRTSEAITSF